MAQLTLQPLLISCNFQDHIKNCNIYDVLPCTALLVQVQKNPTAFGGVMAKKPPRSSLKPNFQLLRKHLKTNNLPTSNAILMKLTTIMYLHETFHLAKN